MSKPIIVLKLHPRAFSKTLELAQTVSASLTSNPGFVNPQPSLAVLNAAITELEGALETWGDTGNRGSHADYLNLSAKAARMQRILKQLADWCMSAVDPDLPNPERAQLLATTGFALKGLRSPQGKLEAVQNFHRFFARTVRENQVKLRWTKPLNVVTNSNVKAYLVYRSRHEVFSTASILSATSHTTYTDEPGAGTWYYWVTAVNNKGQGVVSEMVTGRIADGF